MTGMTDTVLHAGPAIPPDNPGRAAAIAKPDNPDLPHRSIAGDTHTTLSTCGYLPAAGCRHRVTTARKG